MVLLRVLCAAWQLSDFIIPDSFNLLFPHNTREAWFNGDLREQWEIQEMPRRTRRCTVKCDSAEDKKNKAGIEISL